MIGSTKNERELTPEEKTAKRIREQTATIQGCSAELQIQKQQIENLYAHKQKLENLIATQQNELNQLRQQFGILIQSKLGGGPTAR